MKHKKFDSLYSNFILLNICLFIYCECICIDNHMYVREELPEIDSFF